MKDRKIEYRINNIRALAILIVIFGHSIILYSSSWSLYETMQTSPILDNVKKVINLFQMPLFFSLSGYLFTFSKTRPFMDKVFVKKLRRIILPFIFIGALWMIPIKMFVNYSGYQNCSYLQALYRMIINQENGHLWYLPTLFFLFLLFSVYKNLVPNRLYIDIFILVLLVIIGDIWWKLPQWGVPYLNYIYQYAWGFFLGMFLAKNARTKSGGLPLWGKVVLFLGVFFLASIDAIVLNRGDILISLLIVVLFYFVIPDKSIGILNAISKNSFGMYLFHSPLIYITFTYFLNAAPYKVVLFNFVFWGTISYCMTEIVRKMKLGILIGE